MSKAALWLGLAGLLPFICLPIAMWLNYINHASGAMIFTQYSAVILSFLGGVHWYDAISRRENGAQIYLAMLPSLIGWAALIMNGDIRVLGVLSLSYVGVLIFDKYYLHLNKQDVVAYTQLRTVLTAVVVVCHAAVIGLL